MSTERLSREELVELVGRAKKGDTEARHRVFNSHARLVGQIAKPYRNKGIPWNDLLQDGYVGLARSVDLFDPEKKKSFGTYAGYWIKQSILESLESRSRLIRTSHAANRLVRKIRKFGGSDIGIESARLLATELGFSETQVDMVVKALGVRSIGRMFEFVPDRHGDGYATDGGPDIPAAKIHAAVDHLKDERKRKIIRMRYGLDCQEPMSLRLIAAKIGWSLPWCKVLYRDALDEMRDILVNGSHPDVVKMVSVWGGELTDSQWESIRGLIPHAIPGGRSRIVDMRGVVNAIRYQEQMGCTWERLPDRFPNYSNVHRYKMAWVKSGVWAAIVERLRESECSACA